MQSAPRQPYSTVLLILLYAAGTAGAFTTYYTYFHRQSFQAEIKKAKDSDLKRLSFSSEEYQSIEWIDDKTEFEWKGKLYDVSRVDKTIKGYEILCENDEFEEILMAFVKKTKAGSDQTIAKGNIQPQFFSNYILNYSADIFLIDKGTPGRFYFTYHSMSTEVSSPPPEAIA
jgi:hypothetical protein